MGGIGGSGDAGFLSPFDKNAFNQAQQSAIGALTNRYQQLGLGQTGAQPSGPTTGATAGIPGSGTTPTTGGNFGAGSTAMQMDLGQLPSVTGGIPAETQAGLGAVQTADLSQTAQQQSGKSGGNLGNLASGAISGIA